jgi:hypothetical protein
MEEERTDIRTGRELRVTVAVARDEYRNTESLP